MIIKKTIRYFKQLFCKHNFRSLNDEICIGTTLNWALTPTKEFECTYKCLKCSKEEKRKYIYFGGLYDKDESIN